MTDAFGRQPIEFVELEMDACSLTFGTGACPATGEPCYNTWATCQARSAYAATTRVHRYCRPAAGLPVGFDALPAVLGVQYAPQVLTPGKGLGVRGSVTVRLTDVPWSDTADDPYYASRPTGIDAPGSYWARWRARNRYYLGRRLTVKTGYLVGGAIDPGTLEGRVYVLEQIAGPDKNGTVTLTAKDVLKLADDDRAQCPRVSTARLTADLTDSATAFDVYPAGVGDAEFAASGWLRIAGEIMSYTRSGDHFTVTRGQYGTKAEAAKADDLVQQCARFSNQPVQRLIYSLLVDYAKVPASYISLSDWDTERDNKLNGVYSTLIADPIGVNSLIAELCEQGQCYIWWDETLQKIQFRALTAITVDGLPVLSDEDHFLQDSVQLTESTADRQSRFLIRFDQINPTKRLDDASNYRRRHLAADLQSEGEHEHGSAKMRVINSRWFSAGSLARVQQLGAALLKRYRDPPRVLDAQLDSLDAPKTGAFFVPDTAAILLPSGQRAAVPMQVVEQQITTAGAVQRIRAQEVIWTSGDAGDPTILIGVDMWDVNLRALYESEYGTPIAGRTVTFVVQSGVLVSSTQAEMPLSAFWSYDTYPAMSAIPAIDTGVWPDSVQLVLQIAGAVVGRGGAGGMLGRTEDDTDKTYPDRYPGLDRSTAIAGGPGAPGLHNRHVNLTLMIESGGVLSGGGGGGGRGGHKTGTYSRPGIGGSGAPYGGHRPLAADGSPESTELTRTAAKTTGMATWYFTSVPEYHASAGGSGGGWGLPGEPGQSGDYPGGAGGAPGAAIIGIAPVSIVNNGQILGG